MRSAQPGFAMAMAMLAVACSRAPISSSGARSSEPTCYLSSTITAGRYRADTFTIGIPKELEPVQARFAMAIASKQQWLQEYLAKLNLKPGEVLPYDEEMGVTRTEYEALTKAYLNPNFTPSETTYIDVQCSGGMTRFAAKPPYEFLDQITIAVDGTLQAPMNLIIKPEVVSARDARFGVWSGTTWFSESSDVTRGNLRHFELSVGKLDASGRLVLVLQHSMAENHKPVARDQLLTWLARS